MKIEGGMACCERNPSDVLAASGELTGELAETWMCLDSCKRSRYT